MSNTFSRFKFQKMHIEPKRIAKGLDKQRNTLMLTFGIKYFWAGKICTNVKKYIYLMDNEIRISQNVYKG